MPRPYVIDTFAWIEYFAGSVQGQKAQPYIEGPELITPSIVVAEFTDKYTREGLDPSAKLAFIRTRSMISGLDDQVAEEAGRLSASRRKKVPGWGLVDSVVLATARSLGSKVVTGDAHFAGLDETVMI
ncbi:MAG: type II toxin-antitoxin system VapC family toxin [archaeon]|nr:MAG: type II toxin-antitoxin system VapC family toxin [archaeon]